MQMRGKPGHIIALDEAGRNLAGEFHYGTHSWRSARHRRRRSRTWLDRLLMRVPGTVVPLADVAVPVLNFQLNFLIANLESFSMIAVGRGSQQVETIKV